MVTPGRIGNTGHVPHRCIRAILIREQKARNPNCLERRCAVGIVGNVAGVGVQAGDVAPFLYSLAPAADKGLRRAHTFCIGGAEIFQIIVEYGVGPILFSQSQVGRPLDCHVGLADALRVGKRRIIVDARARIGLV